MFNGHWNRVNNLHDEEVPFFEKMALPVLWLFLKKEEN